MPTRGRRLNEKHIPIAMRDRDGTVTLEDVWREDMIEFVGPSGETVTHLVLDFGIEQDLIATVDGPKWQDSDRFAVELQAIDPETRTGYSKPTIKRAMQPPEVPEGFSATNADMFDEPWPDCRLLPVSPRRG